MGKYLLVVLLVIAIMVSMAVGLKWIKNNSSYSNPDSNGNSLNSLNSPTGNNASVQSLQKNLINPRDGQPLKEFTLIGIKTDHLLSQNFSVPVYSFNGIVPGPELRVNQGDFVRVKVINILPEPITVHWHGYPVLSPMDGVAGITQNPILPGDTFTYAFTADIVGTYWYYSPMRSSNQVEDRLYGALIVLPAEKPSVSRDYTLFIEEWGPQTSGANGAARLILSINGRATDLIQPLTAYKNETIRLRLINAGRYPHGIHVPGQIMKVVAADGHDIPGAVEFSNQIVRVEPGDRNDVQFTVDCNESFIIDTHDDTPFASQVKLPFNVIDGNNLVQSEPAGLYSALDISTYGITAEKPLTIPETFKDSIDIDITSKLLNGEQWHFVGGKPFAVQQPILFNSGDYIKLKILNSSKVPHTFHIHGHWFKMLSFNGKPYSALIQKDIVYVKPGDSCTIALRALNPGTWIMACTIHDHGDQSILGLIKYKNYAPDYQVSNTGLR